MASSASASSRFIEHFALTDIGLRRANNQDSLAVALAGNDDDWARRGHLFLVADGMGAHAAGELASKLAADAVPHTYRKVLDRPAPEALKNAIHQANLQIYQRGQDSPEFHGMGTTSSVLVLLPQGAVVAHVGDSRVYRLRHHRLEQLTFDHSLVWEMMAAGQIPRGEIPNFVPKNIITRSLGPHPDVQVDLEGPFPLEVGDTFLLCSDGLTGQVGDALIGMLLDAMPPREAAQALVHLANLRGGPDNVTVVVAKVKSLPPGVAEPEPLAEPAARSGAMPAIWAALVVFALVAAVLGLAGHVLPAVVSAIGAVAALLAGLLSAFGRGERLPAAARTAPLGTGPHAAAVCTPTREVVSELAQMAEQVRQAADDEKLPVDWQPFERHQQAAAQAVEVKDLHAAVRQYALAISALMGQLRPR